MMPDLLLAALLSTAVFTTLAAVYLWSNDPARRSRAWQLIKLIFRG